MDPSHELVEHFTAVGLPLNATLVAMLDEHPDHRTTRRGCGFTQATRHLAARVNEPRAHDHLGDLVLFEQWHDGLTAQRIAESLEDGSIMTWRHWHTAPPARLTPDAISDPGSDIIAAESERQRRLATIGEALEREESRLLASIIIDLILPRDDAAEGLERIVSWPEKLEVGSCPTAEKWFLELAHGFVPRRGRCNIIVDDHRRPLLLEKVNMGDSHSCISLEPFVINGVCIPPGSLLAVTYAESVLEDAPANASLPGQSFRLSSCSGMRMLRLTTLAVSPANRQRAFTAHFEAQQAEGLLAPDDTELGQLRAIAASEVTSTTEPA